MAQSVHFSAEDEDASELKLGPDFMKAQCLLNSEVAILLETNQTHPTASESASDQELSTYL